MWGDVGSIYYWIHRDDLDASVFDRAWMIFQCCRMHMPASGIDDRKHERSGTDAVRVCAARTDLVAAR